MNLIEKLEQTIERAEEWHDGCDYDPDEECIAYIVDHGEEVAAFMRDAVEAAKYLSDGDCEHSCTDEHPCGPCTARAVLDKHRAVIQPEEPGDG